MCKLSVVIPVYNSDTTLLTLADNLFQFFKEGEIELILVNDGSKDKSHKVCKEIVNKYRGCIYLALGKNFGEFNAVMCGLNHVSGPYAVIIDDDFQNPPSEIHKLYDFAIENDLDVVYSQYAKKEHSFFRNIGSKLTNNILSSLIQKPKDLYLSSFKLISKPIVEQITQYKGPYPYIDGLIFQVTDNIGKVEVIHKSRENGSSNYTIGKLLTVFLNAILGYSIFPIRIIQLIGFLFLILSLGSLIKNFGDDSKEMIAIDFLRSGTFLIAIALIGEYLGRLFMMQSGKPQFVVRKKIVSKA